MEKTKSKIIAIIPARLDSKGIPKKNIIDFCGKPLIAWTIEQAKKSEKIDDIYVSTDGEEIASVSEECGAKVIWRPKEISGDSASSEHALKHVLKEINENIDYVVFFQATSPLRETKDIDKAIDKIISEGADSLFSGTELDDFCIWEKEKDIFKSTSYDYMNRKMRQDFEKKQFLENGSFYIFKPDILFKNNNRLGGKIVVSEMEFWKSFEIDNLEGLKFCEELFKIKKYGRK